MSARADMESASARRQSFGAAGVTLPSVLPEGLSASCAVGETRGAMVGDQSLRKAVRGVVERIRGGCDGSGGQRAGRHREAQPIGLLPGSLAVGFFFVVRRVVAQAFANIRHHKGMRRFTLRGKAKVGTQWQLYCLVHNIEKIATRALRTG
jgi:Transposase DDE domain